MTAGRFHRIRGVLLTAIFVLAIPAILSAQGLNWRQYSDAGPGTPVIRISEPNRAGQLQRSDIYRCHHEFEHGQCGFTVERLHRVCGNEYGYDVYQW